MLIVFISQYWNKSNLISFKFIGNLFLKSGKDTFSHSRILFFFFWWWAPPGSPFSEQTWGPSQVSFLGVMDVWFVQPNWVCLFPEKPSCSSTSAVWFMIFPSSLGLQKKKRLVESFIWFEMVFLIWNLEGEVLYRFHFCWMSEKDPNSF